MNVDQLKDCKSPAIASTEANKKESENKLGNHYSVLKIVPHLEIYCFPHHK